VNVQPVSVADAVATELRTRLLSGRYTGGQHLRDTDLEAESGVARPTVWAAVAALVAEGRPERGHGKSAAVRSFSAEDAIDLGRLRRPIEAAAVDLLIALLRPACGGVAELADEHRVLLATLEAGNADRARAAWSAHFDDSERFFLGLIKERAP